MEGSMSSFSSLALLAILAVTGEGTPSVPATETTLLQFSSQQCQHCQSMQPVVAQLAQQGVNVQTIDVDQQLSVARQFQIAGVPTFVAVSGGREIGRIEGVTSPDKLAALVGWAPPPNAAATNVAATAEGWDKLAPASAGPPIPGNDPRSMPSL
jgi:thioredoxin-like negative regulator of GroEL